MADSYFSPKVLLIRRPAFLIFFLAASLAGLSARDVAAAWPDQKPQALQGEHGFSVSSTLFSTLAAINAAGYDAGMDSPLNERYRVRTQVRAEIAKHTIPCLAELKAFYTAHKKASDAADLGQYISFALVAGDAPKF